MKTKNIPEAHQDAFKTGFAEGFLKAQVFLQKTLGKLFQSMYFCLCVQKVVYFSLFNVFLCFLLQIP